MAMVRKSLIGAMALMTSLGVALLPAAPAHAGHLTALDRCVNNNAVSFDSGTFFAYGNNNTRFDLPAEMWHNDAFRITAFGVTYIAPFAEKNVGGDSTPAFDGWPLPGSNQYMLIAKVNTGKVIIDRRTFLANQWFPVGRDSGCFRYERPTPFTPVSPENPSAFLTFSINDPNIRDNYGYANVRVRQWFCAMCSPIVV